MTDSNFPHDNAPSSIPANVDVDVVIDNEVVTRRLVLLAPEYWDYPSQPIYTFYTADVGNAVTA